MVEDTNIRKRATAIIIENDKVLLMHRIKSNVEFFVFPGGGVEEGETIEQALIRESAEELTIKIELYKFLFTVENIVMPPEILTHMSVHNYHCFLIQKYSGTPEIGGPEKMAMNSSNQYHLVWVPILEIDKIKNLYPQEVVTILTEHLKKK